MWRSLGEKKKCHLVAGIVQRDPSCMDILGNGKALKSVVIGFGTRDHSQNHSSRIPGETGIGRARQVGASDRNGGRDTASQPS
jgi:hypothetical protein